MKLPHISLRISATLPQEKCVQKWPLTRLVLTRFTVFSLCHGSKFVLQIIILYAFFFVQSVSVFEKVVQ